MTETESKASRLFDLRYIIGGLFTLYGLILTIVGIVDSRQEIDRAAGVRINLWMGLGMLVLGLLFLAWARWRPLQVGHVDEPTIGQAGDPADSDK
jgi:hypothetical protein